MREAPVAFAPSSQAFNRIGMYPTLESTVGNTPLVRLQRLPGVTSNVILGKLEGNNPAGSVKDRPALSMIQRAEERGEIKPGDTLIEATSGNTGIALAMAAAIKGYRMVLIMPEDLSVERVQTMKAYGAELILTPKSGGMEYARDLALQMQADGKGLVLDQFANPDNPRIHYETTGPEIWADTDGQVTHFVSAMGTTGTITGVSRFLKEKNPAVRILGAQPGGLAGRCHVALDRADPRLVVPPPGNEPHAAIMAPTSTATLPFRRRNPAPAPGNPASAGTSVSSTTSSRSRCAVSAGRVMPVSGSSRPSRSTSR